MLFILKSSLMVYAGSTVGVEALALRLPAVLTRAVHRSKHRFRHAFQLFTHLCFGVYMLRPHYHPVRPGIE